MVKYKGLRELEGLEFDYQCLRSFDLLSENLNN